MLFRSGTSSNRFPDLLLGEGLPTFPEPAGLCMPPRSPFVGLWWVGLLGLEQATRPGLATRSDISAEDPLHMEVDAVDNAPRGML